MAKIDYRHSKDFDEYISRCQQIQILLPALKSFYEQSDATIERLRLKHADDAGFLKLTDFYAALNTLDKAGLALVTEEMNIALQMEKIPPEKRQEFFDQQIRPLENKEDQVSEREVEMAREGKRNGVTLPADISKNLADAK